jgi:hypothetical protein
MLIWQQIYEGTTMFCETERTWESKSHYDRRSVGQSFLVSSPFWGSRWEFCYCQTFAVLSMWDALSSETTVLPFFAIIVSSTCYLHADFASWVLIQFLWWPLFFLLLTRSHWALLKYRCDYFERVFQRRTVYIRSLNWLSWDLLGGMVIYYLKVL